jgi:hypothetical protein
MKTWLGALMASVVLVMICSFAWTHRHHAANAVATHGLEPAANSFGNYAEVRDAQQMVTVTGPMADYVSGQKAGKVETLPTIAYKPVATDHVGDSPVGTSRELLHKTFAVANIVDLPFDVPAHAANPLVRGTYRSYTKQAGASTSDDAADVEFLLMDERQFADFVDGRPGEAIFSAEGAHDQELNTRLPPAFDKAVRYYLVFRNSAKDTGKKVVQADFRIDF